MTNEEYINRAKTIHGDKYGYSMTNYTRNKCKVKIYCNIHEKFFDIRADGHLDGRGCKRCSRNLLDNDTFTEESNIVHDNKYDYSLVDYKDTATEVIIICPTHGEFPQITSSHLKGHGCFKCQKSYNKGGVDLFLEKAKAVHGDRYEYIKESYVSANKKMKIICPIHGEFPQTPSKHTNAKRGCPTCRESKGEREIRLLLDKYDIEFNMQQTFDDCVGVKKLKFDFYLPNSNICIEYDGEQHFNKFRFEKNDDKLKIRQKRDNIKNTYCKNNNIKLFRIKYTESVEEKLDVYLKKEDLI